MLTMSYVSPPESKSRVQNIKKKFELSNTNASLPTNENAHYHKTPASSGEASKQKTSAEWKSCNSTNKNSFPNSSNLNEHIGYDALTLKNSVSETKYERDIASSHVRGNIRRSPAFRCDKIVKGRNVTGQSGGMRERTHSVVNKRLEQFEDSKNVKSMVRKINSSPVVSNEGIQSLSSCDKDVILKDSTRAKEVPVSGLLAADSNGLEHSNKETLCNKASGEGSDKFVMPTSSAIVSQKVNDKSSFFHSQNKKNSLSLKTVAYDKENEITLNHNGKQEQMGKLVKDESSSAFITPPAVNVSKLKTKYSGKEQSSSEAVVPDQASLTDSLRAALKAPLPTGPPPKKPPRTFAHISSQSQKNAPCVGLKENSINYKLSAIGNAHNHVKLPKGETEKQNKSLRTKTESHLMLQKLETVLLSHQQSTGGIVLKPKSPLVKRHMTDKATGPELDVVSAKSLGRIGPLPSVPQDIHENVISKPIDASGVQCNCLDSLSCVSAGANKSLYSQIHFYEKVPEKQCTFFVDIQRASSQPKGSLRSKQQPKPYGTLLAKSRSVEHIYAEPFDFVNKCGDENKHLQDVLSSEKKKKSIPSKDDHNLHSAGLHYLCTPLHPEVSDEADVGQIHKEIKSESNLGDVKTELITAERKEQNPEPHNLAVDGSKKQPPLLRLAALVRCGQGSDNSNTIPCKADRTKIQLIMNQAFGSPLQGLQSNILENMSDSESLASTPEDGGLISDTEGVPASLSLSGGSGARCLDSCNEREDTGSTNSAEQQEQLSRLSEERKVYVHRVSSKVYHHTRSNAPTSSNFPHLFQCILLVGLNLDSTDKKIKVPYVKMKYPPEANVPLHIEHLCFPDAKDWPPTAQSSAINTEQSYSLVITNETGERRFGYCRRVLPEGSSVCLPLAYCIISPFRASGFYHKILVELESRHGQPEWLQSSFIKELYSTRFPGPGQTLKFSTTSSPIGMSGNLSIPVLRRPLDSRFEEQDLTQLFSVLHLPVLLQVFSSLLLERKVILFSNSLSQLSSCVEALQSILYPFSWQHTLIPVLPASLLEICLSPTPYIIGILRGKDAFFETVGSLEESLAVDLDESRVLHCVGDEVSILPSRLRRCLKIALQLVSTSTVPQDPNRNVLISEAFVRVFVEVSGHYRNHIVTQQDGKKVFERESFIKSVSSHSVRMFLEWFTETALFSAFIESRLENESERDMFDHRSFEHSEEMESNTKLFLKNCKVINKKVKTLGDRIKDWTGK